jgi:deazaflavin-dependent oxidoreductase (nitroreductase family)
MLRNLTFKVANAFHRTVLKISGGRAGWRVSGMPVLELTTTGRKTGRPHSVMLTSPIQEERALVVVASRGGDDTPPAWFLNLQDNPEVEVTLQGRPAQRMQARVATSQERDRLWPRIVAGHQNYADYQTRTTRVIPLVLLEQRP